MNVVMATNYSYIMWTIDQKENWRLIMTHRKKNENDENDEEEKLNRRRMKMKIKKYTHTCDLFKHVIDDVIEYDYDHSGN